MNAISRCFQVGGALGLLLLSTGSLSWTAHAHAGIPGEAIPPGGTALLVHPAAPATPEAPSGRAKEFDAAAWGSLLAKYVRQGRIDYAAWKRDGTKELDALLDAMTKHPYRTVFAKEARVAFLVNAYNAFSVRQVLRAYPVASVRDIPGFFDKATFALDGGSYTLDQIETELIAPIASQEPRFHLALARAAMGAPGIYPAPLRGDSLNVQLERIMVGFVRNPAVNRYRSAEPDTLFLSELFQWHRSAFESGDITLVRRVAPNFSLGEMMRLMQEEPPISWIPFDWRLNDVKTAGSGQ